MVLPSIKAQFEVAALLDAIFQLTNQAMVLPYLIFLRELFTESLQEQPKFVDVVRRLVFSSETRVCGLILQIIGRLPNRQTMLLTLVEESMINPLSTEYFGSLLLVSKATDSPADIWMALTNYLFSRFRKSDVSDLLALLNFSQIPPTCYRGVFRVLCCLNK
jgi:hypothetical protein